MSEHARLLDRQETKQNPHLGPLAHLHISAKTALYLIITSPAILLTGEW